MSRAKKSKKGDDWFRPLELVETEELVKELLVRHPISFMALSTCREPVGENGSPIKARIWGDALGVFKLTTQSLKWYLANIGEGDRMRINNYVTFGEREDADE